MAWIKQDYKWIRARGFSSLLAIFLSLPLGWGAMTGVYTWFSPFIMLNSVFVLKSFVWLNLLAFIILGLVLVRKRWFCRNLCPVGWGCDLVSSCSKRENFSLKRVPSIGKWLAVSSLFGLIVGLPLFIIFDPMAIFSGFFLIFSSEITIAVILSFVGLPALLLIHLLYPGVWCAKLCPLGGLQDEIFLIKSRLTRKDGGNGIAKLSVTIGRRLFLGGAVGLLTGMVIPYLLKTKKTYFQPPGAVVEDLFSILCLRCGSCIKSCPSGILVHHADANDKISWMVPEIDFSNGYCLENCNLCSQVCPSGAITLFDKSAKEQLKIGLAEVLPEKCLLAEGKECDRCKSACSYGAITIGPVGGFLAMPIVNKDKCNGCGACAAICPPVTIVMNLPE